MRQHCYTGHIFPDFYVLPQIVLDGADLLQY